MAGEAIACGGSWWDRPRSRALCAAFLLGLQAILAVTSLVGDSITFDETSHLTSGLSYWMTGDFRLAPEHPPLPKLWCALPLLAMDHHWVDRPAGWEQGDFWRVGREWFAAAPNRDALLTVARCMMVVLLLATTWLVYSVARRMWGGRAGLLAMTVAALCPTMLAHGRLVTTDLPAAFFALLTIERCAVLFGAVTPGRMVLAGLALAGFALSKFSWPLIVPALLVMPVVVVWVRRRAEARGDVPVERQWNKNTALGIMVAALVVSLVVWVAVWTCYGWRFSPFANGVHNEGENADPAAWRAVMSDADGVALTGPAATLLGWMHAGRVLPEAYLFGLAYTLKSTQQREAYLMGEYSLHGWRSYFPIAFAVKTPVATLVLMLVGALAMLTRKATFDGHSVLLSGMVVFAGLYGLAGVCGGLNIGHRHLLPVYPLLFVLVGAAGRLTTARAGRIAIGGCVTALVLSTLHVHPHYLSYFNELVGGPAEGHRFLADSNIDWGQDLKRLARYAQAHPEERIKLAYFGSAVPEAYGIEAEMLPSSFPFGAVAELGAGTYVISLTQFLGVYLPESRVENEPATARRILAETNALADGGAVDLPTAWNSPQIRYLRACLLIARLRQFKPDERIGWSMLVYRLTDADAAALASLESRAE